MRRIAITPADRFRRLIVVADVAPDLAREIGHRGKDTAREQVAFDLGKPELDLVEPRGIRRGEVEVHVRMVQQERPNRLGFMSRQIVGDDMNVTTVRLRADDLAEEIDKRGAGVARHRLAEQVETTLC